jgi:hypothetical protein
VVTGCRGAAGNDVDFPLPEGYAFDECALDVAAHVLNRVALSIMEFDSAVAELAPSREIVCAEGASTTTAVTTVLTWLCDPVERCAPLVGSV